MNARPRALPPLMITVLLHSALLLAMLQGIHSQRQKHPRGPAIQWLLPSAPARPLTRPRPSAPALTLHTSKPSVVQEKTVAEKAPAPSPTAASAVAAAATESPRDDPFALDKPALASKAAASADDLLQRARQSAGRIDQQLRAESPQRFPLPPPDSMQAKLERGINAAHEAVPPKWYQGARMVELSTPDGERKSRMYKISTAFGSYCVSISPEGRRSYSNCP
ncbi:hypothetical protein [Duganella qianjiadongensis]|uniref:Uncharacterized protein n=1 Tax=Duganella qianjiadongensis TaxID=2692176 RepID=A0ABW9VKM8_9BURK|nr:hypothetical protein [Duganella qianjiadongensis]MYM40001.1 hypothetical protein [Duganella qianjiadongensis]